MGFFFLFPFLFLVPEEIIPRRADTLRMHPSRGKKNRHSRGDALGLGAVLFPFDLGGYFDWQTPRFGISSHTPGSSFRIVHVFVFRNGFIPAGKLAVMKMDV